MATSNFDANEYACPHCHRSYVASDDDGYRDDVTDECSEKCATCGKRFQVRCTSIQRYFETVPAEPEDE